MLLYRFVVFWWARVEKNLIVTVAPKCYNILIYTNATCSIEGFKKQSRTCWIEEENKTPKKKRKIKHLIQHLQFEFSISGRPEKRRE